MNKIGYEALDFRAFDGNILIYSPESGTDVLNTWIREGYIVTRCTDYKDSLGHFIWQGDILEWESAEGTVRSTMNFGIYDDGLDDEFPVYGYGFYIEHYFVIAEGGNLEIDSPFKLESFSPREMDKFTVVGNIFFNKELLDG